METRRDAGGMEWGVDHTSVRKSIRAARQANPDWGHLAEKMVKGGFWAEDRLERAGIGESQQCCYCACHNADLEHLLWDCPRWEEARKGAGDEAQLARVAHALKQFGDCPMYSQRGIIPWHGAYGSLELAEAVEHADGQLLEHHDVVWTDGSGMHPTDHRRRACSWSVVWQGGHLRGPLPGEQQSVYRAELYAVVRAVEESPSQVTVVSDCLGVVQQAQAVLSGGRTAARRHHADLWARLHRAARARSARGEGTWVRWVPAHVPEDEAGGPKISREDWEGNSWADHWAKESLKDHPDQRARSKLIDECDALALGALKLGIAVYSLVTQDLSLIHI